MTTLEAAALGAAAQLVRVNPGAPVTRRNVVAPAPTLEEVEEERAALVEAEVEAEVAEAPQRHTCHQHKDHLCYHWERPPRP